MPHHPTPTLTLHMRRALAIAAKKGAAAAADAALPLWGLSKRELVEVIMHLSAQVTGEYDDALEDGRAAEAALAEYDALKQAGLF